MTRTLQRALLAAVFLGAAACSGPPPPPPRRAAQPPAPVKPMEDESVVPKAPTNIYVYSPIGKRDPFQNVFAAAGVSALRPTGHKQGPLEKWPLDQLKLEMTVTGTSTPLAMVEDPNHRGWPVRLGDFIGQNGGKVTGIHRTDVVITETITDHSTGRVYPQSVKLEVPVDKEEEHDLDMIKEGEEMRATGGK